MNEMFEKLEVFDSSEKGLHTAKQNLITKE
jgi:hypothetical protein